MTRAVPLAVLLAVLFAASAAPAFARQPEPEPPPADQTEQTEQTGKPTDAEGAAKGKRAKELARQQQLIDDVIAAAEGYLGLPYRLGREGPDIFDCSGLMYRIFADTGQVHRIGGNRLRAAGYMRWFGNRARFVEDVALAERGDLVIYDAGKHIGIYVGKDKVISALVDGVTLHRLEGITLDFTGILKVDWSGEGGDPLPHPAADAVPTAPTDEEAPASLIPPLPWLAPLPDEAPDEIVIDAVERADMRTADSRTFETEDGFVTELFSAPVFYLAPPADDDGSAEAEWQPIDLRLAPVDDGRGNGDDSPADDGSLAVIASPVSVTLSPADAADGFLRLAAGDHTLALELGPQLLPRRRDAALPTNDASARFADYHGLLRGNVGMRVFPRADGVKAFFVLAEPPRRDELSFTVRAPGLALVAEADGSLSLRDPEGIVVGRVPVPLVLDSSDADGGGGGLAAGVATLSVEHDGDAAHVSITLDERYLATASYPIYVDLSLTEFPTAEYSARQTFASSAYPQTSFGAYQRPEWPAHAELWHGRLPGTDDYSEAFLRFADVAATLGGASIESAALRFYPYWQYDLDGRRPTWVSRIAQDWQAAALSWEQRPAVDTELGRFETRAGQWSDIDVTGHVSDVMAGLAADYGFRLHADGGGRGSWKRIVAGADDDPLALAPRLVIRWSDLRPRAVGVTTADDGSGTLAWTHPAVAERVTRYQVQVSTDGFETVLLQTGARGSDLQATTWQLPEATLTDGVEYAWRVRAKYGKGTPWTRWSQPATFVYDAASSEAAPLE